MSALIPAMVLSRPVVANGTHGDIAATIRFEIPKEMSLKSTWITAIAADKAGGWSLVPINKGLHLSPDSWPEGATGRTIELILRPSEDNQWTWQRFSQKKI
jgi:hypothetical protein